MRLLITKILSPTEKQFLNGIRFNYDEAAFIEIEYDIAEEDLLVVKKILDEEIVAIFTSQHAVNAVMKITECVPPLWKVICTEPATRSLIEEWLGSQQIIFSGIDAAAISDFLKNINLKEKVFFFCGNKRSNVIPDTLRNLHQEWQEIKVYKNRPLFHQVIGAYRYFLFFSPGSVDAFYENNKIPNDAIAVAIGRATVSALKRKGVTQIIQSESPSLQSMVQTIQDNEYKK